MRGEIYDAINYLGMERGIRKLALDEKLCSADELSVISLEEVCDLVSQEYTLVYSESERFGLVKNDDLPEYEKIVKKISR